MLEMWKVVDGIVKDDAVFATNTSSLSVADQATVTGRPQSFIGLHFFNPAQVMPLLEVVRADSSDDHAYDHGFEVGEKLGKTTVAARDNRGFIVNRLLVPYMLDAIRALEQGVGSTVDIDTGMMAGASHPMGPLTLADFVGLDTLASIADVMHEAYGEERFAQPDTLRKLVGGGDYGRKSGRGFYDYSGDKPEAVDLGL
jgi:3-hydroxybutyryl-CoA dehydrogenase